MKSTSLNRREKRIYIYIYIIHICRYRAIANPGTYILVADLSILNLQPARTHDITLDQKKLQRGGSGAKDVAERCAAEVVWELWRYIKRKGKNCLKDHVDL